MWAEAVGSHKGNGARYRLEQGCCIGNAKSARMLAARIL